MVYDLTFISQKPKGVKSCEAWTHVRTAIPCGIGWNINDGISHVWFTKATKRPRRFIHTRILVQLKTEYNVLYLNRLKNYDKKWHVLPEDRVLVCLFLEFSAHQVHY